MRIVFIFLVLLSVSSNLQGGEWVASGTTITRKSFVLSRIEAEDLALSKKKLELELEFEKKRSAFYKELSEDAKVVLKYHKEKSGEYRKKWLEAEDRNFKRNNRKNFLYDVGRVILFNQVLKGIKF